MLRDRRIIEDNERVGTRAGGGLHGAREVARTLDGQGQKRQPQLDAHLCYLVEIELGGRIVRVHERADTQRPGRISLRTCILLRLRSWVSKLKPVTLPPGRARLGTRPAPTASATRVITMGTVACGRLAAGPAGHLLPG